MIHYDFFDTPLGPILVARTGIGICQVYLKAHNRAELLTDLRNRFPREEICEDCGAIEEARTRIVSFLSRNSRDFHLPLDLHGTSFQKKVWNALLEIPYGKTRTYREIASEVGNLHAARAVGQAVGKNPVPILVPCHRVIASGGGLGGFSSGIRMKRQLLEIEGVIVPL